MRGSITILVTSTAVLAAAFAVKIASSTGAAGHAQPGVVSALGQEPPALGTRLTPLPDGEGKAVAETSCLACHSSDLIRQQRLTKQQWTATITKMINWGAAVPESQREALLDYLATRFGPENSSFQPVVARPNGRR